MATVAAEDSGGTGAGLFRDLVPIPGRLEFALRLTAICTLTALINEIYALPEVALSVYVAFFLNKADRVGSLIQNVAVAVLISLLVGILFVLANAVLDQPFRLVVCMAAISLLVLFVATASKLDILAGVLALIVAYGLDVLGQAPFGELATRALLYAWLCVLLPCAVSAVVNILVAPAPRGLVQRELARRMRLAAGVLAEPGDAARRALTETLREGDAELLKLLKFAALERTSPGGDLAALRCAAGSSVALLTLVQMADREPSAGLPAPVAARIGCALNTAAKVFARGDFPAGVEVRLPPEMRNELSAGSIAMVDGLAGVMATFAASPPAPERDPELAKQKGGFFKPDAFSNPAYLRGAIKTTAAAMFCYVFYQLLDWPGIHTCMITCYIVALGTTADTIQKMQLRIAGCIIGAAAGIAAMVFLVPDLTSIAALLVVLFACLLPAAWVAAGSERIAYAGYQIAFAFLLCVLQGSGPSFDMTVARDRVIGILIGNLVVFAVTVTIWPVSVGARIDAGMHRVLGLLRSLVLATGAEPRRRALAEAQRALGSVANDLELIGCEPSHIRPADAWIRSRGAIAEQVSLLCGPLFAGVAAGTAGVIARRLEDLAGGAGPAEDAKPIGSSPFAAIIDARLHRIEAECQAERAEASGDPQYAVP
nr:FUSC family protein [uncultured Rhodopila sp.]